MPTLHENIVSLIREKEVRMAVIQKQMDDLTARMRELGTDYNAQKREADALRQAITNAEEALPTELETTERASLPEAEAESSIEPPTRSIPIGDTYAAAVLRVLSRREEMTVREVMAEVPELKDRSYATAYSVLKKMEENGDVKSVHRKDGPTVYRALS